MFLDKWIPKKYLIKPEVYAVEVCFSEERNVFYCAHLRNKENKLELLETRTFQDDLSLPEFVVKNKIPVVLILNGKGIILKKIKLNEGSTLNFDETIKQNLPAINTEEFYFQLYRQNDSTAFITMCRKAQLDKIIKEFSVKKYDLVRVFIGPPSIIGMEPLWSDYNTLTTSIQQVTLTNNLLDTITIKSTTSVEFVKIDSLEFDSSYILGFAGGLSYLMRRQIEENAPDGLNSISKKHIEKNKLRFLTLVSVAIAFVVAVVNVVFYTSYFDTHNKLETQLNVYQGKYEQINQLLSDYQKNKNLIENAGVLGKNRLSEYADKIGKTIPDEVVLGELYFNPKKEEEESSDSLITFQNKYIILKGNCPKSFIINEWINVLKMQRFVKDVGLEKFVYNKDGIQPNFEIKIVTD